MKLLLDTHTFIWFVMGSNQLSPIARELIEDVFNDKLVSHASLWEMSIKHSLGKLNLQLPFRVFIESHLARNGFDILPISDEHIYATTGLHYHHRDPFDRMLIAQALTDRVPVISVDTMFDRYAVTRLW